MRKILVATDFSERSDRAIRRATLLAKSYGAVLTLVHVIDDEQPHRLIKAKEKVASDLLSEQSISIREIDGVDCDFKLEFGEAFKGLMQVSEERDADLLVIGPHRRQILRDVFVGTTAERTIRESRRPVLMANGVPASHYRRAVVAVDMSDCSGDAIRVVQGLRLEKKLDVHVVHVFDAPAASFMRRASSSQEQIKDYVADEEESAHDKLVNFLRDYNLDPVELKLKQAEVSIASTVCDVARNLSAELIVVGTHGRTGGEKRFLGSVGEEVLRIADRDVLAVPPLRTK